MTITYQDYYKNKIGKAYISVSQAIAGSKINCRLTYRVGKVGIDDSGSLKILFRIVSDCGDPQFENEKADNFVSFASNKKNVKIVVFSRSSGVFGKVHERPWSKGFIVGFSGEFLAEGDEIYFDFKNWQVQTFIENEFKIKILVDPFATGRYIELPKSPVIKIIPGNFHSLKILTPSVVRLNTPFRFLIKLEDYWGNPCNNLNGTFEIYNKNSIDVPTKSNFKNGKSIITAKIREAGIFYVMAKYKNLNAVSNPIFSQKKPERYYYWGDFHGQSNESVGTNDINSYFTFARDFAFLDFAGHQANDFQITDYFWKKINSTTKKFTQPGKFIAIPGYEWSGNTSLGGDRNVLYLNEGSPLYRSSYALVDNFSKNSKEIEKVEDLFKNLRGKNALILAHVGGRYSNLNMHDEFLEPAIEVHSDFGTFEWFLFDALDKGYKIGIIANSDSHDGRPGASYPGLGHFHSYGGLSCILADKLDRKSIFNALKKRHVYATTGERIFLAVEAYRLDKKIGIMGDIVKGFITSIKVKVLGTSPIDRLELYDKSKIIGVIYPSLSQSSQKAVKICWAGSNAKGRKKIFSWKGKLTFNGVKITKFEAFNFYNKHSLNKTKNEIFWESVTTGGTQGLILYFTKDSGFLNFFVNKREFTLKISEISQTPKQIKFGGLNAVFEVYQVSTENIPSEIDANFSLKKIQKGFHSYFVKVIQKNCHMAWSSPIYTD